MPKNKYNRLTSEQIDFIINHHTDLKYQQIADYLHISKSKVVAQTQDLQRQGIIGVKPRRRNWTEEEENKLCELLHLPINEIATILNKTFNMVVAKLKNLKRQGVIPKHTIISERDTSMDSCFNSNLSIWTDEEIDLLLNMVSCKSPITIAYSLHKSVYDVITKVRLLMNTNDIKVYYNCKSMYEDFTQQEDDFIIHNLKCMKREGVLSYMPHHTWKKILRRGRIFGIHRNPFNSDCVPTDELIMKRLLDELKIVYVFQQRVYYDSIHYYVVDFILNDNIAIEVQGDYWHCHPSKVPNPTAYQKTRIEHDKIKRMKLRELGYDVYYIWEHELFDEYDKCKQRIQALLPLKSVNC